MMQFRISTVISLAALFTLTIPAQSAGVDQFKPGVGEPVKLWHHAIKAGHMDQARAFFVNTLIPRMQVDNSANDTYFLANERRNEILAISFWGRSDVTVHPHAGAVDEGMKPHAAEPRRLVDYKLVLINDEGLVPQPGDKVVIISRRVKPGKMEETKRAIAEVIFPVLAKDEFTRNGYVLENTAGNELVSLIFMRGDFKAAPELAAKKDEHVKRHLSEPEKTTEYTVFSINNK